MENNLVGGETVVSVLLLVWAIESFHGLFLIHVGRIAHLTLDMNNCSKFDTSYATLTGDTTVKDII